MIALNSPIKPDLKKLQKYLEKINDSSWFTNFGPLHNELKDRLEAYLGVKNLLLVSNGTSALQVAGMALGTQSVLTTPFTFVATASAFKSQNLGLAFSDIDPLSFNLCPKGVDAFYLNDQMNTNDFDTIVPTHVYGNPCDVEGLRQVADKHGKKLIYDTAHAFSVKLGDQSVLNYGDASTLSFHATKVFHTVEGGAVVFKNASDYEKALDIINFGIRPGQGIVRTGLNAKLNEYQAAVGLVNLEIIDDVIDHRRELFEHYTRELGDYVELPKWHNRASKNGAYMAIKLRDKEELKKVSDGLSSLAIQTRNYFSPCLSQVFCSGIQVELSVSKMLTQSVLCLPLHAYMSLKDVKTVSNEIKKVL